MPSSRWWKQFYAEERESTGINGLEELLLNAESILVPKNGAIIFPHTRLSSSGRLIAAAANAVIESNCDSVLALGVLHRPREKAEELRSIHGPDAPKDTGLWRDEFSLDNFEEMLRIASRLAGKPMPKLIARYPFLTGADPESIPGFAEIQKLVLEGAALVATADMIHHGVGYDTPKELLRSRHDAETVAWAKQQILESLSKLMQRDYQSFLDECTELRSDFRDSGPVLSTLFSGIAASASIVESILVDYSDVLQADEPTWVAGALVVYGQTIPTLS